PQGAAAYCHISGLTITFSVEPAFSDRVWAYFLPSGQVTLISHLPTGASLLTTGETPRLERPTVTLQSATPTAMTLILEPEPEHPPPPRGSCRVVAGAAALWPPPPWRFGCRSSSASTATSALPPMATVVLNSCQP